MLRIRQTNLSTLVIFLLLILITPCVAFQFPFKFPFKLPFFDNKASDSVTTQDDKPRIAIIGAGAAGTSAAFWIAKAKERFNIDVQIDVYERSSYVGGRSTTVYPYGDTSLPAIELGASPLLSVYRNLLRASHEFNLTFRPMEMGADGVAIWDGRRIVFRLGGRGSNLNTARVFWNYGPLAYFRSSKLVNSLIDRSVELYSRNSPRWDNISNLASILGWSEAMSQTTLEYFKGHGISHKWATEMVEASTRLIYGQNVDQIHALAGVVAVSTTHGFYVDGGEWQIYDQFVQHSGARLLVNSAVHSIMPSSSSSNPWAVRSDHGTINYQGVIIAAPFHLTQIEVPPTLAAQIPPQPYVHLHVTVLTTTSPTPNPKYFGLPARARIPSSILTSFEGARAGGIEPDFNHLLYYLALPPREANPGPEWVVKIVSNRRISDESLASIFNDQVGWVHRKEWDAFPQLSPTPTFPPVKLDTGLYYVNALEPLISNMEAATIASRNVVDLLLNEEFGSGICGPQLAPSDVQETQYNPWFILGWDC